MQHSPSSLCRQQQQWTNELSFKMILVSLEGQKPILHILALTWPEFAHVGG